MSKNLLIGPDVRARARACVMMGVYDVDVYLIYISVYVVSS